MKGGKGRRRVSQAALLVGFFLVFVLVSGDVGLAGADMISSYSDHPGAANHAAPAPLTVNNNNVRVRCRALLVTVRITSTVNAAGTQGVITINIPARCAGVALAAFHNPGLLFRSVNNMATGMSLTSNPPWTAPGTGQLTLCVARQNSPCLTTTMVLMSGSSSGPTSVVAVANARNFGPSVQVTQGMGAGTSATVGLDLYQDFRNTATGDYAVIQVDHVTLVVNQA